MVVLCTTRFNLKHDRQCRYSYNVILTWGVVNNDAVEKKSIFHSECVCNLSYRVCKSQTHFYAYILVCDLSSCPIFFTLSHKQHEFLKKNFVWHKVHVLTHSTNVARNIYHSKKNSARHDHKLQGYVNWSTIIIVIF